MTNISYSLKISNEVDDDDKKYGRIAIIYSERDIWRNELTYGEVVALRDELNKIIDQESYDASQLRI